jgi:hypothetical protein
MSDEWTTKIQRLRRIIRKSAQKNAFEILSAEKHLVEV